MPKIRLRAKFLLSLLVIIAGLTSATLFIVRYRIQKQVREALRIDLRNSLNTYRSFEIQRESTLTRSAKLIANLPDVRALMTTRDPATIQDASADFFRLSGSDLLVLADRKGNVQALQTSTPGFARNTAQQLLLNSLGRGDARDWWYGSGRLYEVWNQPIYFGAASQNTMMGVLAIGHEIDDRAAKDFGNIAAGEVAFRCGDTIVASTLSSNQRMELTRQLKAGPERLGEVSQEIRIGTEQYLATTISLSADGGPSVSLSVLKSFDKATSFLADLNHVLLGLGLLSVLVGSVLVFVLSHTLTRPLANLVGGVRALEEGNFSYPLIGSGGDEVAEVTDAFVRMRINLQKTQEDQKVLEERLRQAHKMEAVGRLAGGVAHDFNNLLTIIRGNSDLLIDRQGKDEVNLRYVEQIQKAAGRAVSMTRQLLAFSRMQVLQPSVLDLNAIVGEMGKMLPRLIGEHIEYKFNPGLNLSAVKADPGQVEQVIMNLAVNSRDAMPGGGTLTIDTSNVSINEAEAVKHPPMSPGSYVLMSVKDTGHGMDEKTKAHIFEPFFTTKEIGKGTGLGLATVYGIVKQSGGFIWVDSFPGKGTTFNIYLPPTSGLNVKVEAEAKPLSTPGGTETILVVEDELGVRELACEFLRAKGYSVLEAKDGVEALEVVTRHSGTIGLILTDMIMPRMGGLELAQRLKTIRPNVKVAFMTGYSEYSDAEVVEGSPQSHILQKPFSEPALVGMVRELLASDSLEPTSGATLRR